MKILIIDDRPQRDLICRLKMEKFFQDYKVSQPKTCHSVKEALELIKEHQPQIIILDFIFCHGLSEWGGPETAQKLKEKNWSGIIISHSSWTIKKQKINYEELTEYVKYFVSKGPGGVDKIIEIITSL